MDISSTPNAQPAQGASTAGAGLIAESSTARFQADVIDASREVPVLVDFWAPWCGPCKQLTPALEAVVTGLKGKIRLVKINVDDNQALAGQMGVQSIPAVFAFLGGRPVDGFMGALPQSEIAKFANKIVDAAVQAGIGGPNKAEAEIEAALEAADAALAQNDLERAFQIYALILQRVPDNIQALLGVARVQIENGEHDAAGQTLEALPPEHGQTADVEALRTAIALAKEARALGDPAELAQRLDADPDDHRARFDLAMIANAKGGKREAVEGLIEIMRRDREWNEDGARKKLIALFEAWGPKDPETVKGRRMLSSLLFR